MEKEQSKILVVKEISEITCWEMGQYMRNGFKTQLIDGIFYAQR